MALSPTKYVTNYTSNYTSHKGVEAKDVELADTPLDPDVTLSTVTSQLRGDTSGGGGSSACAPADHCASYLQVVVEKHRRERTRAQSQARHPRASSPRPRPSSLQPVPVVGGCGGGDERAVLVMPHSVVVACRCSRAAACHVECGARADTDAPPDAPPPPAAQHPALQKNKSWKIFGDLKCTRHSYGGCGEPERVEVYYFEQGAGEWLAAGDAGRVTWCERAARGGGGRAARALLAELCAAPALLAAAPLHVALGVQRAVLSVARAAVLGSVQAASDHALKPALALLHNALLRPLLVFAANTARLVRAALRPLAGALGDALEPAVRLLASVRLVDVHVGCAHHA